MFCTADFIIIIVAWSSVVCRNKGKVRWLGCSLRWCFRRAARYADELRPRLPRLRYSNVPPPPRSRPGMPILTEINGLFLSSRHLLEAAKRLLATGTIHSFGCTLNFWKASCLWLPGCSSVQDNTLNHKKCQLTLKS